MEKYIYNIVGAISNFIRPATSWAMDGYSSSDVFKKALADPKCGVSVGCHPHYVSPPFYTYIQHFNNHIIGP